VVSKRIAPGLLDQTCIDRWFRIRLGFCYPTVEHAGCNDYPEKTKEGDCWRIMLKEYLIKKALDYSFDAAKEIATKILNESKSTLLTTREDVEGSLDIHLRSVMNWSGAVSFSDLKKAKRTTEIYIDLDLDVLPRRMRIDPDERVDRIPIQRILDSSENHVVLLGQPGAGKTTSMKYLCQLLFRDETFHSDRFSFPLLIKFRELNNPKLRSEGSLLIDQIFAVLGLRVSYPVIRKKKLSLVEKKRRQLAGGAAPAPEENQVEINVADLKRKLVVSFLEEFRVLLILDGFDELAHGNRRVEAIEDISGFATQLSQSTMIVTSRTGDFKFNIDNTDHYEICPLNKDQVTAFANKWLGDEQAAVDFLGKVYSSPFADTAIRPLNLAHLCAIYERIKNIPEKPKTVYKKIVNLLLEEWDQQRSIKRESRYANFEVDRKYDFLCHLAFVLTRSLQRTVFSSNDILKVYHEIHDEYGLGDREAQQVVNELETHNGLFLQSGYDQFEFAHKSLQEFLAAEYLVKLPRIPEDWRIPTKLPNELAIAVAISSSPADYFVELVLTRLSGRVVKEDFVRAFLNRLLIEKPEFKSTIWLDLAWLVLYRSHVESNVIGKEHTGPFYLDPAIKEFEAVRGLIRQSFMATLLRCYDVRNRFIMKDGDALYKLIRVRELSAEHLLPVKKALPKVLYARRSLLALFGLGPT
jgi:hypothetical protein